MTVIQMLWLEMEERLIFTLYLLYFVLGKMIHC